LEQGQERGARGAIALRHRPIGLCRPVNLFRARAPRAKRMDMDVGEKLLGRCAIITSHCGTGLITPEEFVNALFEQLAFHESGLTHLVARHARFAESASPGQTGVLPEWQKGTRQINPGGPLALIAGAGARGARSLFSERVMEVLQPEFRFPPWNTDGCRPRTRKRTSKNRSCLRGGFRPGRRSSRVTLS